MEKLRGKKGFICDMDGVIYHGNCLLPGAAEIVGFMLDFIILLCYNTSVIEL